MISVVTLFARDIERTADVYRLLGSSSFSPGMVLGFDVADLEDTRAKLLAAEVPVQRDIGSAPSMRRMIVTDPERRQIFIRERVRNA